APGSAWRLAAQVHRKAAKRQAPSAKRAKRQERQARQAPRAPRAPSVPSAKRAKRQAPSAKRAKRQARQAPSAPSAKRQARQAPSAPRTPSFSLFLVIPGGLSGSSRSKVAGSRATGPGREANRRAPLRESPSTVQRT